VDYGQVDDRQLPPALTGGLPRPRSSEVLRLLRLGAGPSWAGAAARRSARAATILQPNWVRLGVSGWTSVGLGVTGVTLHPGPDVPL